MTKMNFEAAYNTYPYFTLCAFSNYSQLVSFGIFCYKIFLVFRTIVRPNQANSFENVFEKFGGCKSPIQSLQYYKYKKYYV